MLVPSTCCLVRGISRHVRGTVFEIDVGPRQDRRIERGGSMAIQRFARYRQPTPRLSASLLPTTTTAPPARQSRAIPIGWMLTDFALVLAVGPTVQQSVLCRVPSRRTGLDRRAPSAEALPKA